MKEGDIANIHNILFTLNRPQEGAINIQLEGGVYTINSPFSGQFMRMADQFQGTIKADTDMPLQIKILVYIA